MRYHSLQSVCLLLLSIAITMPLSGCARISAKLDANTVQTSLRTDGYYLLTESHSEPKKRSYLYYRFLAGSKMRELRVAHSAMPISASGEVSDAPSGYSVLTWYRVSGRQHKPTGYYEINFPIRYGKLLIEGAVYADQAGNLYSLGRNSKRLEFIAD